MKNKSHRHLALWLALLLVMLAGCRSRGINITITNNGPAPVRNVELDYPGGTFGTAAIQPNASFPYRIKIIGNGALRLIFEEAHGKTHHENGPEVRAGDDGLITITIDKDANNTWKTDVQGQ